MAQAYGSDDRVSEAVADVVVEDMLEDGRTPFPSVLHNCVFLIQTPGSDPESPQLAPAAR